MFVATRWGIILAVWVRYFLMFIPGSPQIGILADAVCIFVQAFGRNHFVDSELGRILWKIRMEARMDDLESFTLLKWQDFDPGAANRALAKVAMRFSQAYEIPIIAQWEVVFAIFEMDVAWYLLHRHAIDAVWPPKEEYFATYHVKTLSRERMRIRGLVGRPLELAHPAMLIRAIPICWKVGVDPVVEGMPFLGFWNHELWVWDENSVQSCTRRFFPNWILREVPGRLFHVFFSIFPRTRVFLPHIVANKLPGNWIAFRPR